MTKLVLFLTFLSGVAPLDDLRFLFPSLVPAFGQSQTDEFPPPGRLRTPMKTAYRQIVSAAPPAPYPRSKEALNLPLLSMNEPLTDTIIEDIREGVRYVLQTKSDFIIPIHGTGSTAISAILDNLIESGDRVVVGVNGYWGELMANMTSRLGAQLTILEKPVGTRYSLSEIDAALRLYRPKILALVHGESSSTVVQQMDGIGELCASQGVLLVVDTVATAGMQPILMDKYKIDAAFTSSHKGIGGVVGLGVVALSSRAVEKILQRRTPPHGYQTDLMIQARLLNTSDPGRVRFQSMSLPLLYAFREALANIVAEGKENVFSRHKRTSDQLSRGMEALGLEHFIPDPDMRLTSIVGFKIPTGKDVRKIATFMFQNHNIEISTGFGPTSGQMLRFAAFASNADTRKVNNIIRGMREALQTAETNLDERYYF